MNKTKGYATTSPTSPLVPFQFERRPLGPHDVQIEILYCGICHSDLHVARNEWENTIYPVVPGHEIVGRISQIGSHVKKFQTGDTVAVGCMVDSCQQCSHCKTGFEQYCETGFTLTYNSKEKETGKQTFGGYSDNIIVAENFVLRLPKELDIQYAAPLLCAGITTYSPLRHWKVTKGKKVGIIGLGGLGHMGVKIAHALGAHVTMITTSPNKEKDAKHLGAHEVLISTDPIMMKEHAKSFDFLLNTIPRSHDVNPYMQLLKADGVMVIVGAIEMLTTGVDLRQLIFKRNTIAGSLIGGIQETQEMLDFCAEKNILPDVEIISIQKVNEAYERMLKGDVKYRFVIDMASLK